MPCSEFLNFNIRPAGTGYLLLIVTGIERPHLSISLLWLQEFAGGCFLHPDSSALLFRSRKAWLRFRSTLKAPDHASPFYAAHNVSLPGLARRPWIVW